MNAKLVLIRYSGRQWTWALSLSKLVDVNNTNLGGYNTKASARRAARKWANKLRLTITKETTE